MHSNFTFTSRENPFQPQNIDELLTLGNFQDQAFIRISPTIANSILETCNTKNRPMSQATVKKYVSDMRQNRWVQGVTDIGFNLAHQLSDGQHRMSAIVQSEMAQTFSVMFNQPDETFHVIDSGKKRTPADVLSLEGYQNKTTLSSALRKYNHYCVKKGNMWNINTPCNSQEALAIVKNSPELQKFASFADSNRGAQRLGNKSDIAVIYFILSKIDSKLADVFMSDFLFNETETTYQGINYHALITATRNKLLDNKNSKTKLHASKKADPHEAESRTYWYFFDAWNKFISNVNTVPSFKVSRKNEESFPRVQNFI